MNNTEIARVFSNIAALLQLDGEQVFKTRAYARAADVIADHPGEIESIADDLDALKVGRLREALRRARPPDSSGSGWPPSPSPSNDIAGPGKRWSAPCARENMCVNARSGGGTGALPLRSCMDRRPTSVPMAVSTTMTMCLAVGRSS